MRQGGGLLQLGRYRLDEQVGQGGMAVVWRGFDTQLMRTVAVKVLHAHLHGREEIRRRFSREARAVARLHHSHILDVYDSSAPTDEPSWLVMEFIRGTTLRQFADLHPFDPPELAACCLLPLAEALGHAHDAGVVHRDVKPENVMLREDGLVKLTDFGIAAVVEPDEKFTATGQILGSPAHLAPEIIEGKPASAQSDLFSLGTVLYWLSCGQLPFLAPTPAALLRLILECKPKDPRMVRPSISDAQAAIILRLLQREPEARHTSAGELARDLTRLLNDAGVDKPRDELANFVQSQPPEDYAGVLRERLVARSLQKGDEALAARQTPQALAAFSRALALEPKNEQASMQVQRIHQRARRVKLVRRGALGASLVLLASLGGTRATSWWHGQQSPPATVAPVVIAEPPKPEGPLPERPAGDQGSAKKRLEESEERDDEKTAAPRKKEPPKAPPADKPPAKEPPKVARVDPPGKPKQAPPRALFVHVMMEYPVMLFIDDQPMSKQEEIEFRFPLEPGVHRALVRKACCEDRIYDLDPTKESEVRWKVGNPRPAHVYVRNAQPDEQVKIDGALVGTVADLVGRPFTLGMDAPKRDVKITVGEKTWTWTVKAGAQQAFDALRPGGVQ